MGYFEARKEFGFEGDREYLEECLLRMKHFLPDSGAMELSVGVAENPSEQAKEELED